MDRDFGVNQALVEERFIQWMENPSSVDESWRRYFDNLPPTEWPQLTSVGTIPAVEVGPEAAFAEASRSNGSGNGHGKLESMGERSGDGAFFSSLPATAEAVPFVERRKRHRTSFPPSSEMLAATELQGRVSALVNAYRVRGHLFADLDPLGLHDQPPNEFLLERYGLAKVERDTVFSAGDMAGPPVMTLQEILDRLNETYTRSIGIEFTFLEDRRARRWLQESMETTCNRLELTHDEQIRILSKLTDAETFEQFLHTKFKGAKRFSLEGGESVIPMLDYLVERASGLGVEEIVIGMAHRGRLNVLANIVEMNVRDIFAGFEDENPDAYLGGGDVKYHLGFSHDRKTLSGREVHLTLSFNPSHLEFVNPVVCGRVRAKQDRRGDTERKQVLPILIHGDAAFVGQGVVAETLNLSELEAYAVGGAIHVVINNQIGFTTMPGDSRSTRYCTDITRMLRCPVFHVNGEDPEAVAQVVRLATEYRQRYHRDVVIDLFSYRKYGHNEGDEPRFTQPMMYNAIEKKKTVREVYIDRLLETGKITEEQAQDIVERRRHELEAALEESHSGDYHMLPDSMGGLWSNYNGGLEPQDDTKTGIPRERLEYLMDCITTVPDDFKPHRTIQRAVLDKQRKMRESGQDLDWGAAENLAAATLLADGTRVRLTGQDVRRGTFSHRHAVIFDSETGRRYCRLAHLGDAQAELEIYDSPLSEAGVLGFEWGYSLDSPDALVLWEAQFGDFANSAQVIIDQFICSSEDKWHRLSGLVLLLPHGFEGQGPEHSSARLERFLGLCAEDNMQVCNLTTPAQLFHCLRRQAVRKWRKPLVIMTPKSLLRHPRATSTLDELSNGRFQRFVRDDGIDPKKVSRILLCSGKVYYDLLAYREEHKVEDIAVIRCEQLYPLRAEDIEAVLSPFVNATELVWTQEEPWNMGAWFFMQARLPQYIGPRLQLRCATRPESASPATGSKAAHLVEQARLIKEAFSR